MRKTILGLAGLAGLSTLTTAAALEVTLGTIEGRSAAGEPVSARIPLREVSPEELVHIDVGLAPSRIFDRAGIERTPELSLLDFELVAEGAEAPYIEVTSEQPIDEPLLDFLVQVSWPEGDLVREYTLLLERPATVGEDAPAQGQPADITEEPFEEVTRHGGEGAERRRTAYGPVEEGDTLWRIAAEHRPDDSVTIAQTMLAIKELNPHAFADDNVNDLLSGWWLRLPDREQVEAISASEAQSTYEDHLARWVPPAERRAVAEELDPEVPIPDLDEPAEDAPSVDEARLRILALEDDAAADEVLALLDADLEGSEENVRRLQGALAALREERHSLEAERENLQARVEDLSERVAALERLVDLQMEGLLPPPEEAEPTPRTPLPEVDEPLHPEAEDPEEVARPQELEEDEDDAAAWARWLGGDEGVGAADLWQDEATQRQILIATGVTLLGFAAVAGFLMRRRRRAQAAESGLRLDPADLSFDFDGEQQPRSRRDPLEVANEYLGDGNLRAAREVLERGLDQEPGRADLRLRLMDVLGRQGARQDFLDQGRALRDRVTGDADPVWLAALALGQQYAPDAPLFGGTGEEGQEPASADAAQTPSAEEQETAAEEPAAEAEKPDLEELDLALEPDDGTSLPEPEEAAAAPGADESEGEAETGAGADDDFDRRLDAAFEGDAEAEEGGAAPGAESEAAASAAEEDEPAASADAQDMVDELFGAEEDDELAEMDLDSLLSEDEEEAESSAETAVAGDEGDEDFAAGEADPFATELDEVEASEADEDDEPGGPAPGTGDEADTKLDLARAYIDLGDEAGARELLEEVIEEGTESQRENARRILNEFGD